MKIQIKKSGTVQRLFVGYKKAFGERTRVTPFVFFSHVESIYNDLPVEPYLKAAEFCSVHNESLVAVEEIVFTDAGIAPVEYADFYGGDYVWKSGGLSKIERLLTQMQKYKSGLLLEQKKAEETLIEKAIAEGEEVCS
ncbi:MAG: hypothetical protein KGN01_06665 [Patescibacteria group bacterium]|nr:hypothetical protein [Patescibacteria group bacterium]